MDVGAAQAATDVDRRQADRLHAIRIERHQYLAIHAANALDLGHTAQTLQRTLDHVVDEPGELFRRLGRRDRRVGDDWQADDVDTLDQRLLYVFRHLSAEPTGPGL